MGVIYPVGLSEAMAVLYPVCVMYPLGIMYPVGVM